MHEYVVVLSGTAVMVKSPWIPSFFQMSAVAYLLPEFNAICMATCPRPNSTLPPKPYDSFGTLRATRDRNEDNHCQLQPEPQALVSVESFHFASVHEQFWKLAGLGKDGSLDMDLHLSLAVHGSVCLPTWSSVNGGHQTTLVS